MERFKMERERAMLPPPPPPLASDVDGATDDAVPAP
jgi:hypothetical protein